MSKFGIKEVVDGIFYDISGAKEKPVMFLDTLKLSNLENSAETSYVTGGKGNGRIMSFDYGRTAQFAIQDALMRPESIAMQAGAEVVKGVTTAHKREVVTVSGGEAKLEFAPLTNSVTVYKSADGSEHTEEIEPTATAETLTFGEEVQDGDKVIVYYKYETGENAETVTISSDKYSGFYKFVGQTVMRNAQTNKDELFEVEIPRVKILSDFSINLTADGEPAVFDMNLDVFRGSDNADMVILKRIG